MKIYKRWKKILITLLIIGPVSYTHLDAIVEDMALNSTGEEEVFVYTK